MIKETKFKQNDSFYQRSDYSYYVITQQNYNQVLKFIVDCFLKYEPLTVFMGISRKEFEEYCSIYINRCIEDSIGTIMVDNKSDEIVLANVQCDFFKLIEEYKQINKEITQRINSSSKLHYMEKIQNRIHSKSYCEYFPNVDRMKKFFHLTLIGMDPKYRGLGLPETSLRDQMKYHPIMKDYSVLLAESLNPKCEKLMERMGAEVLSYCEYESFIMDGFVPFKGITKYSLENLGMKDVTRASLVMLDFGVEKTILVKNEWDDDE